MGIRGGHKLTDRIDKIDSSQFVIIINSLYQLKKDEGKLGTDPRSSPSVDLDASWIIRKLKCSNQARMGYLIRLSKIILRLGIDVVVVCDGPIRHHLKRAKTQRDALAKQNQIDYKSLSLQLMSTVTSIEATNDCNEKQIIMAKKTVITNKLEKLRKKLYSNLFDVGDSFYNELCIEAELINHEMELTNKITIIQTKYQADSLMAYRTINNQSDICFANDTDQAALCGAKCMSVREFSISKNNQTLNNISLFSGCINTIYNISNYIRLPHDDSRIMKATFAVFQGITDVRCRALIAIGLGCDVYDLPIISPPKMFEWITSKQEIQSSDLFDHLLDHLVTKRIQKNKEDNNQIVRKQYHDMLHILVDTYIFEPIIILQCSDPKIPIIEFEYITYPIPLNFHYYIKDFNFDDSEYENRQVDTVSNTMKQCVGPGAGTHLFLLGEGFGECELCSRFVCVYCRFIFEEKKYCVDCYQKQQGILDDVDHLSAETMIAELAQHGMQLNVTDPIESIIGIYNSTINNNSNVIYSKDMLENEIQYPLETSNYCNDLPVITTFDFDNGGIFIHDIRLSDTNRVEILQLFSQLLIFSEDRNENYMDDTYMLLPDMIIRFAQQSRLHFAYRLLKRTLRHCLEFETFNISSGIACVIMYKGKTGLLLKQKVKASMRGNIYDTQVVFTMDELVSCSCTCQSGGQNEERIVCVHILPIIYKITLLLFDGLAEHILVELCAHYNSRGVLTYVDPENQILKESTLILKKLTINYTLEDDVKDVRSLLESFTVGTERTKRMKLTDNQTSMIPFRKMNHSSLRKKIANRVIANRLIVDSSESELPELEEHIMEDGNSEVEEMTKDTYIAILKTISAFFTFMKKQDNNFDDNFISNIIGYRIIASRAEIDFATIKSPSDELKKQIKMLVHEASSEVRILDRNNLPINSNSQIEIDDDWNEIRSNEEENDDESLAPTDLFQSTTAIKIRSEDKTYYTCCVCGKTSTAFPELHFYDLPITQQKDLHKNSSDKIRFTHAKRQLREQMYFQRWNISRNGSVKRLLFCTDHIEESEYLQILFKNRAGIVVSKNDWVTVPKDPTLESSRTRIDSLKRKPYERKRKEKPIKKQDV